MGSMLPGAAAAIRDLGAADRAALVRFAVLASFPPGGALVDGAAEAPRVRRWVDGWPAGRDVGVGWPAQGDLRGAAWARCVAPVIARDDRDRPLPEVVLAVDEDVRGRGVGTALVAALVRRAARAGWPGLALAVSPRNPAAVAVYRRCGFVPRDDLTAEGGLLTMTLALGPGQPAW